MKDSHKAFVDEYLVNGMNATRAYMFVYTKATLKTAEVQGHTLLKRDDIKAYIVEHQRRVSSTLDISKEELIRDLIDIKNANKDDRPIISTKAIEIINKMMGYNSIEKQEIKLQGDINWNEVKTYKK